MLTTTTTRATTLVALLLALAAPASAQKQPEQQDPTDASRLDLELAAQAPIDVPSLVRSAARMLSAQAWIDPQVTQLTVTFSADVGKSGLTWGALKAVLDQHDVVIVEGRPQAGGPWLVRAHHRRNLNQKEGPPWRVVPADEVPATDELITAVISVRHGQGNSIFATVRGLLTRDTNRLGNILYLPGVEKIVLVDLASKVRYYRDVVAQLDVPEVADGSSAMTLPLAHADAQRVASALWAVYPQKQAEGPLVGPNNQVIRPPPSLRVTYDPRTNQLILAGPAALVAEAERLAKALDVQVAERSTDVVIRAFDVKADAGEVYRALDQVLSALDSANAVRVRPRLTLSGKRLVVVVHKADVPRVEEALRVVDP